MRTFGLYSFLTLGALLSVVDGFASVSSKRESLPLAQSSSPVALQSTVFEASDSFSCSDGTAINNRHSASDWLYNIKSLPNSKVLTEIKKPVLAVAGWSVFVSVAHAALACSSNASWRSLATRLCIPATAHSFLVSALGLLLVFRTNSSYQRFYVSVPFCPPGDSFAHTHSKNLGTPFPLLPQEGRKIWENILNVSRNLSRMIQLYSKDVGDSRRRRLMNLIAAYPYLLRLHIRPGCLCEEPQNIPPEDKILILDSPPAAVDARYEGDKKAVCTLPQQDCWVDRKNFPWSLFSETSLSQLSRVKNRPLWVCDRMGQEIMGVKYGPNYTSRERLTMLSMVNKLTDALGQCERIRQTAVPLNYARHSLRSLTLWLFTLPFALVKDMGLMTGPVTACVAWLLYGIYQIGYSIEDPFQGSLRLSILCDSIRRDVLGLMENNDHRDCSYYANESLEEPLYGTPQASDHSYETLILPVSDHQVASLLLQTTLGKNNRSKVEQLDGERIKIGTDLVKSKMK